MLRHANPDASFQSKHPSPQAHQPFDEQVDRLLRGMSIQLPTRRRTGDQLYLSAPGCVNLLQPNLSRPKMANVLAGLDFLV